MRLSRKAAVIASVLFLGGLALSVYAVDQSTKPRRADHTFSFGGFKENQGIEILDWRYGHSVTTRAPAWALKAGHVSRGGAFYILTIGDSLYVKWRVTSTGAVFEDTVDLKSRLPQRMEDKIIHFVINGSQLYVYLIEGNDPSKFHAKAAPACPAFQYDMFKCTEIYPGHWTNF
jgi:hypothetical protein